VCSPANTEGNARENKERREERKKERKWKAWKKESEGGRDVDKRKGETERGAGERDVGIKKKRKRKCI